MTERQLYAWKNPIWEGSKFPQGHRYRNVEQAAHWWVSSMLTLDKKLVGPQLIYRWHASLNFFTGEDADHLVEAEAKTIRPAIRNAALLGMLEGVGNPNPRYQVFETIGNIFHLSRALSISELARIQLEGRMN